MLKLCVALDELKELTIIIPSISVGNIPQLAIDLIVQNIDCVKIGLGWFDGFLPFAGPNSFEDNEDIFSSIEVYFSKEKNLMLFQFRSPLADDTAEKEFVEKLYEFLKSFKCWPSSRLVVLSSIYFESRIDEEITDRSEFASFRYIESTMAKSNNGFGLDKLGWLRFKTERFNDVKDEDDLCGIKYWGPGFGYKLFTECDKELPTVLLLSFGADGYNICDAEKFVAYLNSWLSIFPKDYKLSHPLSWEGMTDEETYA